MVKLFFFWLSIISIVFFLYFVFIKDDDENG